MLENKQKRYSRVQTSLPPMSLNKQRVVIARYQLLSLCWWREVSTKCLLKTRPARVNHFSFSISLMRSFSKLGIFFDCLDIVGNWNTHTQTYYSIFWLEINEYLLLLFILTNCNQTSAFHLLRFWYTHTYRCIEAFVHARGLGVVLNWSGQVHNIIGKFYFFIHHRQLTPNHLL